jgi:uncharacterized membrane protein HdeD (DUF308 family)
MSNFRLLKAFAKNWWVLLVRGLTAILFGTMAFAWPGPTLMALVLLYGAYALVDGTTAIWAGAAGRAWWLVLSGLAGVAVGIGTFFYPGITAIALFYLIAAWAVVRGILEVIAAVELRKVIDGEWALILGGIFSIGFGLLLIAYPAPGLLAVMWLMGGYALGFGAVMTFLAFRLRDLPEKLELHPEKAA